MPNDLHFNSAASMYESRKQNQGEYQFDRNITRDPENIITIFTVNTRPQFSASAGVKFEGRKQDERYRKVGSISDPKYYVDDLSIEGSKNQKKISNDDGEWVAMDWLNPANVFQLNQDFDVPGAIEDGTNLLARGVFYIKRPYSSTKGNAGDKPTEEEVSAAEVRYRKRLTSLAELYETTRISNPAALTRLNTEEMRDALNFMGMETPLTSSVAPKVTCLNCGEKKMLGAKFHKSETLGAICIEPTTEGWKAAVNAGLKKREEVPEGLGWPGRA